MLVGVQVSDSSSRTKGGQFTRYFGKIRLVSGQKRRCNHLASFKNIRTVRELSVSLKGDGRWKNKQSAHGAVMKDVRSVRRIVGQNYGMVVANAKLKFTQILRWAVRRPEEGLSRLLGAPCDGLDLRT
jgi:hypothetical protein